LIDVARRAHRPWLPLSHISCGRPIMQRTGSLGWGLGDGSCTSGGLNYACRKAHCTRRTAQCQSRNDINTAAPVQCSLTLTPACCCVRTSQCNVTPVLVTNPAQVNPCRLLVLSVKTSSYIVPVSTAHCHCLCTSNIKRTRRRLDTCLIQCVSHAAVHWSSRAVEWSVK